MSKKEFNMLPKIGSVIFEDNYHLIVFFKNGVVKEVDAQTFINDERLKDYFNEIRDNIELFKNPISVSEEGIIWTDMADISARGLWMWGKGLDGKTALLEKIAFPKIKELPCGLTLVNYSDEKIHQNTPHYHLYHGNEAVGVISVNGPDERIDRCENVYCSEFKEVREYVDSNKDLLTQIYEATDGNAKKELAKQLP